MDNYTKQHLANWAEQQFVDDVERDKIVDMLTELWNSDEEYWTAHSHSWWEMLDIGRRNREMRTAKAMKSICKS